MVRLFLILAMFAICGCTSRTALPMNSVERVFVALPSGMAEYDVSLGDYLLMEQTVIREKSFRIKQDVHSQIPGSLGFPFNFHLKAGNLIPTVKLGEETLFRAAKGSFSADHSLLGSVAADEDEIGVIADKLGNPIKWYVDNSRYNGVARGDAHWERAIKPEELPWIEPRVIESTEKGSPYRYIQLLSVSWPIIKMKYSENWEGKTDEASLEANGEDPEIVVKGFKFRIRKASSSLLKVERLR